MSSRREQKEHLRSEREQREATAKAAAGRSRIIGYGVGIGLTVIALIVGVLLLGGGDDGGSGGSTSADVLPDGGSAPAPKTGMSLAAAAKGAGCELGSYKATGRAPHSADLDEKIEWPTKPPAGGRHFQEWADDEAYEEAPHINMLVHTLEHGRIIVWFKKSLPAKERANLKALYDEDTYQMVLTPDETGSPYQVAATAWNGEPQPNGTGRLLGCPKYNDAVFDAIRTFKDEHRGNGPEVVQ
jgi:hypothetical protein